MEDIRKYTEQNRKAWNEIADVRAKRWAEKNPLEQLREGGTLSADLRKAAGSLLGKSLLHLQCASGEDSLSWASLGAIVTAVDISDRLIHHAKQRAEDAGLEIEFIAADIYQLPDELQQQSFDLVYTGGGVLTWLPDLPQWARVIAKALKPGGLFVIEEEHPLAQALTVAQGAITISEDYFQGGRAIPEPPGWNHFDDHGVGTEPKYEFLWNLGEVVTALAKAGLRINLLEESPTVADQKWRYRDRLDEAARLPGVFLLAATKVTGNTGELRWIGNSPS